MIQEIYDTTTDSSRDTDQITSPFAQNTKRLISRNWLLIDNQSKNKILCNEDILNNIKTVSITLHLISDEGTTKTNKRV